ncbi:MAG: hypothetical protein K0Q73_2661 [Paenibacillus sp.]|jgi:hypothetical protein|nr:hypothetical protein [Paenibacillus sp.]
MYLIPKNVGGRFEFIEGFGIKELIFCAGGALIGVGVMFLLDFMGASRFVKILPIPGFAAIVFFFVREDPRLGKSMMTNFIDQKKFLSKPRRYHYIFGEGRKRK